MHENSRDYTDFSIDGVLYRFKVCTFVHYIDDILSFSTNESEHLKHIEIVLKLLNIFRIPITTYCDDTNPLVVKVASSVNNGF